eukprot:GHVP01010877.1.p2 GENE.GHVP01010877.1~~GHVP01010877.1.p2  ORF type:complete len:251 (-),score=46.17 GHVP01010877.1:1168-1920(-)
MATSAGYDLSVSTFSPDGRVFQVEYAVKATEKSTPIVAVVCKDGVLVGAKRTILNQLNIPSSNPAVFAVDRHIAAVATGLVADGRLLVQRARQEAAEYAKTFGHEIPCRVLAERVAQYAHHFTLVWSTRPFGASVMFASYTKNGGDLYSVDPTGVCAKHFGNGLGEGQQLTKTEIEKSDFMNKTLDEALPEVLKILQQTSEEKSTKKHYDIGWVRLNSGGMPEFQMAPKDIVANRVEEITRLVEQMEIDG